MGRITNADKSEVLRSLTVEEYGNKAIFSSRNGNGTLSVTVKDPKREERNSLRQFVEGIAQAAVESGESITDLNAILAEMDKRDEAATETWGDRKEREFSISFWLEPEIMAAISNVYDDNDLNVNVSSTIREALSGGTSNTKGF